jgi:tRNA pseudouridine55 synthase
LNGFLNVDKPAGITSFGIIRKLKKLLPRIKLGHLGTLDPMATGVLPVAIGYATRLIEYVGETDKVYQAEMTLGGVSDTQDAWGDITYQPGIHFRPDRLPLVVARFLGPIKQLPPMYSAVHHQGSRLYELARQGVTVERVPRDILVNYIKLLSVGQDVNGRPVVSLEVGCSQGTYIRTLCHDIGLELGTGAYLSALIRTRSGSFDIKSAHSLDHIMQSGAAIVDLIKPADSPLQHLPRVQVTAEQAGLIVNGNPLDVPDAVEPGLARIYNPQGIFTAVARADRYGDRSRLQPLKVLLARS